MRRQAIAGNACLVLVAVVLNIAQSSAFAFSTPWGGSRLRIQRGQGGERKPDNGDRTLLRRVPELKGLRTTVACIGAGGTLLAMASLGGGWTGSLIGVDDTWALWAAVAGGAAGGIQMEKTAVGRALSGAVSAMLLTTLMAALRILPSTPAPAIPALQAVVVSLATPLLLLGADLNVILGRTGSMLKAFLLGTLGTVLGSCIAFLVMGGWIGAAMGNEGWKVGAALTAKNIGGGLNFMAAAQTLSVSAVAISASLAVDNVLGLVYFPLMSYLGRAEPPDNAGADPTARKKTRGKTTPASESELTDRAPPAEAELEAVHTLETVSMAVFIGCTLAAVADYLARYTGFPAPTTSTALAVLLATLFPQPLSKVAPSAQLIGKQLLYLFFASVGVSSAPAFASLSQGMALPLFGFGAILYVVHVTFILGVGRLFNLDKRDLLLASNANIGNPATAAAMATARGWNSRVLPAILTGTLGNAVGTIVGLALGKYVLLPLSAL